MTVRLSSGAAALVLVALLATACDGGDSTSTDADPATERTTGTPAAEGTGPESPAPGGNGQPGIETAGLPVGYSVDGQSERCVTVNWRGDLAKIEEGIEVTAKVILAPPGTATGPCGGKPPCEGFTFTSNNLTCSVKVSLESGSATLSLGGRVNCSLPQERCESFVNSFREESIELTGPDEVSGPIDGESGPIDRESGPRPPVVEEPPSHSE